MSAPLYAIGDIHGQLAMLERALALVFADGGAEAEIVFLGDLVDRGADSRGVIQRLMQGQAAGRRWHVLKGNHDRMFAGFLRDGTVRDARMSAELTWIHRRLGGLATLASYGVVPDADTELPDLLAAARAAVPADHRAFLDSLQLTLERDGLLFVHAGIRPGVALADQVEDDLIWIRDVFLNATDPHPWLVVHGHTALDQPRHFGNRIDLDGGAGFGRLIHPAVFEGQDCFLLTEAGRVPLTPWG